MKKKGKESLLLLLYLRSRRHLHSPTAATASASATAGLSSVSSQEQMGMDSPDRYSYNPKLKWNSVVEAYFVKAYGEHHFSRISKALTCPSTYSCIRVNALKSTTESVIDKLTSFLDEKRLNVDAGLIALDKNGGSPQVVSEYSVELPSDYSSQSPSGTFANGCTPSIYKCPLPGLDNVIFVKGSGPHIIEYAHELEQPMKEVIVSRKCAEAVLRGAQVFVPGVLACSSHVEVGDTVAVSVAVEQPDHDSSWSFGFTRGTVLKGTHTDPQYSERNGLYIGQGITMMSRAGIFRALKGVAIEMKNRVYDLPSFNDVLEGEIFLQNLPSIVTAHVLAPQQGERILDMCAAPGGKTTAIAILMKNIGEVVAVDRSHNKVLDILKLAAEMGLNCITAYKLDALKAVWKEDESIESALPHNSCNSVGLAKTLELTLQRSVDASTDSVDGNEKLVQGTSKPKGNTSKSSERLRNGPGRNNCTGARVEKSKGFLPDSFDRVLLDAPCSALGLRPRLFAGEVTMESLRNHGKYQRRMFDQAVRLVRPGGVIVYSTCTINPGENEALVRYALDTYKFLSLAQQLPKVGGPGLVGHCELPDGQYVEEWLRPGEEELVQRFDPSSSLDTIGFFIAKFDVGEKE